MACAIQTYYKGVIFFTWALVWSFGVSNTKKIVFYIYEDLYRFVKIAIHTFIYSRITMALMEDTGWYLPNYAMAEELTWGAGLGCDFALKSCKETMP